jgi:hypothetical protein
MQICWDILTKEIKKENPIYRRSLGAIFRSPRGRAGKPRTITLEEYYGTSINERPHSARDLSNSRSNGRDSI